jgi:hypothetical protein
MSKADRIIERFFNNEYPEEIRKKFFLWLIHPHSSMEKEAGLNRLWENLHVTADCSKEES